MRRYLKSLYYLLRHKGFVFSECRKLGVPLWIAIFHDWDKFLPELFFAYANAMFARDENERQQRRSAFQWAKLVHQHRNKHHWQFWVFIDDCGQIDCLPIPDVYRREMLADWRGAAVSMDKPDILGWYRDCHEAMNFHPETRTWLEQQIGYQGRELP